MALRLRLPELLDERGWTAYRLSVESGGRIGLSAAYRFCRLRGRLRMFDAEILEALCDTLGVSVAEIIVSVSPRRSRARGGRR